MFLFILLSSFWCDTYWQGCVLNSTSLTAIGPTDQWFCILYREKDEKEKYFYNSDFFSSTTGSKAPANSDLNQHHANMFHSPKVTQTSGPTVLFFKVCHWAASVYGFFFNLSLITLTAKRSFHHPWCVRIKISGPRNIVKLVWDVVFYWYNFFMLLEYISIFCSYCQIYYKWWTNSI